ncbi:MAG: NAD(P)H-dependent oxidoreductase [Propionibacteriaceae bacterium]|nr:NAD(P)H-dependent oxidoreductase [Propionibacteriaceae bacterium]
MSEDRVRILALVGSLRQGSVNRQLVRLVQEGLSAGVEIESFEELKAIPPFDEDDEGQVPDVVLELRRRIAEADAVLVATPEYNSSVPGQLKNALDWASRPFATNELRGKPVAVVGASPSGGGARSAIADAQRILQRIGATVIDETYSLARAFGKLDESGQLNSPESKEGMAAVVAALVRKSRETA